MRWWLYFDVGIFLFQKRWMNSSLQSVHVEKMKTSIRICLYQMALGWCFWKILKVFNALVKMKFSHVQWVCTLKFSPCATPRKNICMGERKAANRQFELLTQKTKSIAIQLQCTKCSAPAVTYIYIIYMWNMTHICSQVKRFFVPKSAWRIIMHLNCHQKPFQDQLIMTCASPYIFITY